MRDTFREIFPKKSRVIFVFFLPLFPLFLLLLFFACLFVFRSARNKSANQKPAGNFKMALPLSEEDKFVFVEMLQSNPWRTATTETRLARATSLLPVKRTMV